MLQILGHWIVIISFAFYGGEMEIETQSQMNTFHCQSTALMFNMKWFFFNSVVVYAQVCSALQAPIEYAASLNMAKQQFLDAVSLSLCIKNVWSIAQTPAFQRAMKGNHIKHNFHMDNRRCCCCIFQMRTSFESHFSTSFLCSFAFFVMCVCVFLLLVTLFTCAYTSSTLLLFSFCRWVPG